MARFGERFLLGFTSPRNPNLITKYIEVIEKNNLDGEAYDVRFQEVFYNVLSEAKVAGEEAGQAKDKALAGRDKLTRMPQALGFFITQNGKPFKITTAGNLLKDENLFEDVLLHQLLKFQLPSKLHQESKTNKGYFNIKPFLELIRLVDRLEYLTYTELYIFGMTLTDYRKFDATVNAIKQYRISRKTEQNKRQFDYDVHVKVFSDLYRDIIDSGNISTRETPTTTPEEFMKKKLRNWGDYTDSIFRLLRSSGLFVLTRGNSLSISSNRQKEVDYLLKHVERDILPLDISREEYDAYLTNPYIPTLLTDDKEQLIDSLVDSGSYGENTEELYLLKQRLGKQRQLNREAKVRKQISSLKSGDKSQINDILSVFKAIKNKEIQPASMRPTFFEWNIWRAMTMINHGDIKGNFRVDDSGVPISTAGGGQSDIIGDYGDFNIGVEVTLSTGKKQYEMEGEPVSRHIGEMQLKKPTFGIFIAEEVVDTVVHHFYTLSHQNSKIYNGVVDIIPMNIDTFIAFFEKATGKNISPQDLYSIHQHSITVSKKMLIEGKTEDDWHRSVLDKVFDIVS